jgi:hypothetical protein
MPDPHQEIADLEVEIEELSDSAERCRKTIKAAKLSVVLGGSLTVSIMTGMLSLPPLAFIAGISATLGGMALIGSTHSTLDELIKSIGDHEARRVELINRLQLRTIDVHAGQGAA